MQRPDIYQYEDPKRFLADVLDHRQKVEPGFSLRAWSKEMGLSSHSLLVMLLHGKRPLRVKHAAFLSKGLGLSSQEQLYFQAMLQFHSARAPEEKVLCQTWLEQLHPQGHLDEKFNSKEIDEYKLLSDWLYSFLLAATRVKGLEYDPVTLSRRLGGKISAVQISTAIERLVEMGLLTQENGKYKTTSQRITTKNDIRNEGAKIYHQQVAELAKEAVEHQDPLEREFQSCSLAVDPDKLDLAKEMIRKFRNDFSNAMASERSTEVYQLNLQLFRLTEGPLRRTSPKARAKLSLNPQKQGVLQ